MNKIKSYLSLCVKSNGIIIGQDKLKQSKKDQNEISTSSIQLNNNLSDNEIQNESTEQMIDNIIKAQKGSYCRIKHHKMKYNGGNKLDYCGHINQQKINHVDIDLANF